MLCMPLPDVPGAGHSHIPTKVVQDSCVVSRDQYRFSGSLSPSPRPGPRWKDTNVLPHHSAAWLAAVSKGIFVLWWSDTLVLPVLPLRFLHALPSAGSSLLPHALCTHRLPSSSEHTLNKQTGSVPREDGQGRTTSCVMSHSVAQMC